MHSSIQYRHNADIPLGFGCVQWESHLCRSVYYNNSGQNTCSISSLCQPSPLYSSHYHCMGDPWQCLWQFSVVRTLSISQYLGLSWHHNNILCLAGWFDDDNNKLNTGDCTLLWRYTRSKDAYNMFLLRKVCQAMSIIFGNAFIDDLSTDKAIFSNMPFISKSPLYCLFLTWPWGIKLLHGSYMPSALAGPDINRVFHNRPTMNGIAQLLQLL